MNKRMVLAFALAVVFFVLYVHFVLPWFAPVHEQGPAEAAQQQPSANAAPAAQAAAPSIASTAEALVAAPPPAQPQASAGPFEIPARYRQDNLNARDERTLSSDFLTVVFTPVSGSIKSVTLNGKAFTSFEQTGQLVLLKDFTTGRFPTQITALAGEDEASRLWALESLQATGKPGEPQRITFATVFASGLKVTKTYTLEGGKYGLALDVNVQNLGAARQVTYDLTGPAGIPSENYESADILAVLASVPAVEGIRGKMDYQEKPALALLSSLGKDSLAAPPGRRALYAGAANRYFASVLRPDPSVPLASAGCFAVADSERAKLFIGDKDPVKTAAEYSDRDRATYFKDIFYTAGSKFVVGPADLGAAGSPPPR